jgi:hypothetical protein
VARQTRGRAERWFLRRGLHVRRENLSRSREPGPLETCEAERDAIPSPERLCVEVLDITAQNVVDDDFGEIAQRGANGRQEMHLACSREQFLRRRCLRRVEDAMHVDEPLAGLNHGGSRACGTGEEELVSRVEDAWRPLDVSERERPPAQSRHAVGAQRSDKCGRRAPVNDEGPLALVTKDGRSGCLCRVPPTGVRRDLRGQGHDIVLDDQFELRDWPQPKPRIPAEDCRHTSYEQGLDAATLA